MLRALRHERGKGDHRHAGGVETRYEFTDLDALLADFEHTEDDRVTVPFDAVEIRMALAQAA
ncbi:MAG: hypothetical protein U1A72_05625 [Sulfuritalea sp.]|nr:hypothetical protein [Sulfuritalea sp.]